jgi:hypothetical protein
VPSSSDFAKFRIKRIAIAAYRRGPSFDRAIVEFSLAYADQNERDHKALADAVKSGRITAQTWV